MRGTYDPEKTARPCLVVRHQPPCRCYRRVTAFRTREPTVSSEASFSTEAVTSTSTYAAAASSPRQGRGYQTYSHRRPCPDRSTRCLGTLVGDVRRAGAPCWAAGPVGAAIAPQERTEHKRCAEQDRLKRERHDQGGLRPAMPLRDVREVKQRRPVPRTGVHDLKHGLKVSIQINDRARPTLECHGLIPLIPPSMRYPAWKPHGLSGPRVNALATDLRRQGARGNDSFLILEVMNVQRRAFSMRGQRAREFEDHLAVLTPPPKLEDFAGVSVFQSQVSGRFLTHGRCGSRRRPDPTA
jgi:hypothetical protein